MAGEAEATEALERLAAQWRRPLEPATAEALLTYGKLLLAWNERINLTGADSLTTLIAQHYSDAFAVAEHFRGSVVDVGSGGGLPSLPATLLGPSASLVLVEPIAKKVAFLRTAVRTLNLADRVSVAANRLADDGSLAGGLGPFDVAVSRATFNAAEWLARARPLVRVGGTIIALTTSAVVPTPAGIMQSGAMEYGSNRWVLTYGRST